MKQSKREKLQKNYELLQQIWNNPELFYRIQQNYEVMLNLVSLIDIVVQDLNEHAPFLFHDKSQCYRRLNRELDACMENLRTDPILFGAAKADVYEDQIKTSYKLLDIFKGILLRCNTDEGLMQVDSVVKLNIISPAIERADKHRIASETIKRHASEYSPENLERWRKYEADNAPKEISTKDK